MSGYRPAPSEDLEGSRIWVDYQPLDAGEAATLLTRTQDLLSAGDAEGLVALMGPGSDGDEFQFAILRETEGLAETHRTEMIAALRELFAAGSRPLIQGYFPGAGDFKDPESSLAVVIDGWRGAFRLATPTPAAVESPGMGLPDSPGDTAIWRFERDGDEWRWRGWHYLDGGYGSTVGAFAGLFGDARHPLNYEVVRPRAVWPTPAVESTSEVPSPDGRWVARTITGKGNVIDPRDEGSWRKYRALEVTDATGKVIWRPVEAWDRDGFPSTQTSIFAWRPDSRWLLYSTVDVPDGCGGPLGVDPHRLDVTTGISGTFGAGGWGHTLDASGQRLAWISRAADGSGEIHALTLGSGTAVTGTVSAGELDTPLWSPDGRSVVFTVGFDPGEPCGQPTRTGLNVFDTGTSEVRTVLSTAPGWRYVNAWQPDGTLVVTVQDDWNEPLHTVYVDAATGHEHLDITPTVTP